MKKIKTAFFLPIYRKAIKTGKLPHPGLCNTILYAILGTSKKANFYTPDTKRHKELSACFRQIVPSLEDHDMLRMMSSDVDTGVLLSIHWGEDRIHVIKPRSVDGYSKISGKTLTERRATLLLLMAAMNNEL